MGADMKNTNRKGDIPNVYVSNFGVFEIPEYVAKTIKFNKKGKIKHEDNLSFYIWLHNQEVLVGKPNDCIFETDRYGWKEKIYKIK
jgi:hypothetical protein